MTSWGESSSEELSVIIRKCCCILKSYSWLIDAYLLDFFTEDLWKRLPDSWQEVMNATDFSELGSWLEFSQAPRLCRPWPLSLLALRVVACDLCLPRRPSPSHTVCSLPQKYYQAFQKHVSPKKSHEIHNMAKAVCEMAVDAKVTHIVDVGSGVGHLARLLSYGYGLSVCCIDAQLDLSSKARKLDAELEKTLSKIMPEEQLRALPRPAHVSYKVGPGVKETDFVQVVLQAFDQDSWPPGGGFGIVGLHPCGDLAPYLMHIFVNCPDARFLCIAGCCYMKLTPGIGFPLSAKVMTPIEAESLWDFQPSYESREMSCHAIETYSRNLLTGNTSSLKIHCYRAALEVIIAKNWPTLRRRGLRNLKYNEHLPFSEYARRALSAENVTPSEADIESEQVKECLGRWRQVVCFYTLRLFFAPLVETLLLTDRLLFLSLQGFDWLVSSCHVVTVTDLPVRVPNARLEMHRKSANLCINVSVAGTAVDASVTTEANEMLHGLIMTKMIRLCTSTSAKDAPQNLEMNWAAS